MPVTDKRRLSPIKIILLSGLLLFCCFIAFTIHYSVGNETVFYTEEDRILHYLNTPEVFKQLPRVSDKIRYSTRIPDGVGRSQSYNITFYKVPNLLQAEQQLTSFFQQRGYQLSKLTLAEIANVYTYYLSQDGLTSYKTPMKEYTIITEPPDIIKVYIIEILDKGY